MLFPDASLTAQIVGVMGSLGVISKAAVYIHSVYTHRQMQSLDEDEIDDAIKNDPELSRDRMKFLRSAIRRQYEERMETSMRQINDNAVLVQIIFDLVTTLGRGRNRAELRNEITAIINKYTFPSRQLVVGLISTIFESDANATVLREDYERISIDHDDKGDIT